MSTSKILKWVTGALEAVLGIPVLGGAIILSFFWTPLLLMLILHIVTLVLTSKEDGAKAGSILGIVTSCIGWIPIVGMIMHIITAVFLIIDAAKSETASKTKAEIVR
ncbi:hypothetical protein D3H55_09670 [Bacillus salacetis]|uniref:Uncharacterized protein n=1 Tax=Bacillus salacetis TaxID=2315464 RepID=A0A3A1R1S5_9BACI|nr:hypothetical protein [Bacillus salacetis]RIW34243.1 hypothetical protein D3H55_09670 [Bacillus salacetis]